MSAAVAVFGIALLAALLYAVLEKQAPAYALSLIHISEPTRH